MLIGSEISFVGNLVAYNDLVELMTLPGPGDPAYQDLFL